MKTLIIILSWLFLILFDRYFYPKRNDSNNLIIRYLFATVPDYHKPVYPLYRFIQFLLVVIIDYILYYYFGLLPAIAFIVPHLFESFDLGYYFINRKEFAELWDYQSGNETPDWLNYFFCYLVFKTGFKVYKFIAMGIIGFAIGIFLMLV